MSTHASRDNNPIPGSGQSLVSAPDPAEPSRWTPIEPPSVGAPTNRPPTSPLPEIQPPVITPTTDQVPTAHPQWDAWQPKPISSNDRPVASPGARIRARLLNEVIAMLIMVFPMMIMAPLLGILMVETPGAEVPPQFFHQFIIVGVGIGLLVLMPIQIINEVVLVKAFGGNIGKLMMGLRIVDIDTGVFMSFKRAFLRYLIIYGPLDVLLILVAFVTSSSAFILNGVGVLWWVVLMMSIAPAPPTFQGFQDRWSGSRVVKKMKTV